jgi:L-aspartate oxidase
MPETDFLVVGSGIAGLSFALRTAQSMPGANITIVSKNNLAESNTRYAQGGIAVVSDLRSDSFDSHIEDTVKAGDGLCDPQVVEFVIKEAPARLEELVRWGVSFDKGSDGKYHLGREGGHRENRVLHKGDFTGREIENCLVRQVLSQSNIRILEFHLALDLITGGHRCAGAYVLDSRAKIISPILSKITVIASGGVGQVYAHTTNPGVATGDGIAMAYRAGVNVRDMEFIQFHPTCLYEENNTSPFLISEAVRGFGAILRNVRGERFMSKYDSRLELASRDIVSRAIQTEMVRHRSKYVLLDCSHLEKNSFQRQFPTIYEKLVCLGIDIKSDPIPVIPSAHYSCGGIVTDHNGSTSLKGLYACGEAACTGLHGANRLASNSLLEALVFSQRASSDAIQKLHDLIIPSALFDSLKVYPSKYSPEFLQQQRTGIQELMSSVAIRTSDAQLHAAYDHLLVMERDFRKSKNQAAVTPDVVEFQNLLCVAKLIVESSIRRQDCKGSFYKDKDVVLA